MAKTVTTDTDHSARAWSRTRVCRRACALCDAGHGSAATGARIMPAVAWL